MSDFDDREEEHDEDEDDIEYTIKVSFFLDSKKFLIWGIFLPKIDYFSLQFLCQNFLVKFIIRVFPRIFYESQNLPYI